MRHDAPTAQRGILVLEFCSGVALSLKRAWPHEGDIQFFNFLGLKLHAALRHAIYVTSAVLAPVRGGPPAKLLGNVPLQMLGAVLPSSGSVTEAINSPALTNTG